MGNVKDLVRPDKMSGKESHTLVKDLLKQSLSKGKVKSLKLKIKMGNDKK